MLEGAEKKGFFRGMERPLSFLAERAWPAVDVAENDDAIVVRAEVPGCQGEGSKSLALGLLRPALSGRYRAQLADGSAVQVRPLLDHLREHLDASYTPEKEAGVTCLGE
jgi:hypothetical protein